jgi:hypothetical protein
MPFWGKAELMSNPYASGKLTKEVSAEFAEKKMGKPKLRSIEVERATNGGFIATHRFVNTNGPYREAENATFGADEGQKLLSHMKEHLGIKGKAEAE